MISLRLALPFSSLLFCLLELNSDHPLAFGLRTSDIVHIFLANSLCFDDFRINAGRGEIAVPDLGYLMSTVHLLLSLHIPCSLHHHIQHHCHLNH